MASNKRLVKRVTPFLDRGERLDAVFPAQTGLSPVIWPLISPPVGIALSQSSFDGRLDGARLVAIALSLGAVGGLAVAFASRGWIVAATEGRVLVLATGRLFQARPTSVDAELPREKFGRTSGLIWRRVRVGDRVMRVHWRFAGAVGDADDALTRDGDRSTPDAAAGPSLREKALFVAFVVAVMVGVPFVASRWSDDDGGSEPTFPAGPVTVIGSGSLADGWTWRAEAYRNVKGHACSSAVVDSPSVATTWPVDGADARGKATTPAPMGRTMSSGGGRSCDSRFPGRLGGTGAGRIGRVLEGVVDDDVATVEVRACDGSVERVKPVSAIGKRWIAVGLTKPTRELTGRRADGRTAGRYVVEDRGVAVDGKVLGPGSRAPEPGAKFKFVSVSPCNPRVPI